jgi:hypothetical protein
VITGLVNRNSVARIANPRVTSNSSIIRAFLRRWVAKALTLFFK